MGKLVGYTRTNDGLVVVQLRNAANMNELSVPVLADLCSLFSSTVSGTKALILKSTGRYFSVGRKSLSFSSADEITRELNFLAHAVRLMAEAEVPVVAIAEGHARGAGLSLFLAADYRIATDRASFAPGYGALGLPPDGGLTWLLPKAVGNANALWWMKDQSRLSAVSAADFGIVHEVARGGPDCDERAMHFISNNESREALNLVSSAHTERGSLKIAIEAEHALMASMLVQRNEQNFGQDLS